MRLSLLTATCLVLTLTVVGCAKPWPFSSEVSQKRTATYKPYYRPGEEKPATPQTPSQTPAAAPAAPVAAATPAPVVAPKTKLKAALLLPLTGPNAALGQAMMNAAQQAVFDASDQGSFELIPRDTTAEGGAEEAARTAIASGAKLIIGPLFAADVPAVKLVAQVNGVMMLPLSTDTSLADRGVYVMGLAPGAQVERVVAFAFSRGARNFAALVPSTPYGSLVGEVFRKAVTDRGGALVDFNYVDPASRELDARIKALVAQRDKIDALFLPETDARLKSIADQLLAGGFDPARTHILGTGLWDVPAMGRQSALMVGAWYAAPDPALRRAFVSSYKAAYNQEPPRLATLAYDATALAAVVAKRGGRYDESVLTNPNGYAGLDGIFRLSANGEVERAMAINEITPDGARIVDAAPNSFSAPKK